MAGVITDTFPSNSDRPNRCIMQTDCKIGHVYLKNPMVLIEQRNIFSKHWMIEAATMALRSIHRHCMTRN
jgi:hypothetical protein